MNTLKELEQQVASGEAHERAVHIGIAVCFSIILITLVITAAAMVH